MSRTNENSPYTYVGLKRIQKVCAPMENRMSNLSLGKFKKIQNLAIGEQETDIWIDRLINNLKELTRDIKQNPKVRGNLLAHFICGDILAIKENYQGIYISEKHFLATIPGVVINSKGKIICRCLDAANEQLRWLFMPVLSQLLKNEN